MADWLNLGAIRDMVLNPWLLLGLWVFGAIIWFIPPESFGDDAITDFIIAYHGWIGLGTLGLFSLWAALTLKAVGELLKVMWKRREDRLWFAAKEEQERKRREAERREEEERERQRKEEVLKHLDTLTEQERWVLTYCMERQERTVYMRIHEKVAQSLDSKGLMEMHGGVGSQWEWAFTIPTFVWDYLMEHKRKLLPDEVLQQEGFHEELDRFVENLREI